jgi:tRNA modification GTPase
MTLDLGRKDTICALSSAVGRAALALVRVSGPEANGILARIFRKKSGELKPFTASLGDIISHDRMLDEVMVVSFPDGRSFSGEPSFEIHCHGNPIIVDEILALICQNGARLAKPGEFSLRALLSGKIDLAQAESIADLIHAQSHEAKESALLGLKGGLYEKTAAVRESIITSLAEIEARMDFPDEELGVYDHRALKTTLQEAMNMLDRLLDHAAYSIKLHEGVRVVICGAPNAGKSTLFNQICGEERAIVHESAGTTRDVIEGRVNLSGIAVTLLDVAGLRDVDAEGHVERIGIEKAKAEIRRADLIIWLADGTLPNPFGDFLVTRALEEATCPVLRVLNKADVARPKQGENYDFAISAHSGLGLAEVLARVSSLLSLGEYKSGELFVTRARQRDELKEVRHALGETKKALEDGMVDEVIAGELRRAGLAFDRLFGSDLSEMVLDRIFSQFCIGK